MNPLPQDPDYIQLCNSLPTTFDLKIIVNFDTADVKCTGDVAAADKVTVDIMGPVACEPSLMMSSAAYSGMVVSHLLDGYSASLLSIVKTTAATNQLELFLTCSCVASDAQLFESEKNGAPRRPGMFTSDMPWWKKLLGGNLFKFVTGGRALDRDTGHQPIYFPREKTLLHCAGTKYHAYKLIHTADGLVTTTDAGAWTPPEFNTKAYYCMHPHFDPVKQSMLTYTFRHSVFRKRTSITFFEYFADADSAPAQVEYVINERVALHMFGFTKNYFIVFANPLKLEKCGQAKLIFGKPILRAIDDSFISNLIIHFIPRTPGRQAFVIDTNFQGYVYHTINCFEEGDDEGTIIMDAFVSDLNAARESSQFELNGDHKVYDNNGDPYRFVVSPAHGTVQMKLLAAVVDSTIDFHCINPALHGTRHQHTWIVGHKRERDMNGHFRVIKSTLHKVNATACVEDTQYEAEGAYFRAPMFVPRLGAEAEDDGYIFMWVYQGQSRHAVLQILNAQTLEMKLAVHFGDLSIPYSVHSWNQLLEI